MAGRATDRFGAVSPTFRPGVAGADLTRCLPPFVTDALREYIVARYGVGAMDMTTAEIFEGLKETDVPEDLYQEMKDLFERADFVKFAKFTASDEENAQVLPQAVRFVTTTYQTQLEEENQEKEG